jgi:hypothetical protein
MISRRTVYDAFVAALEAAVWVPVRPWSRQVEDVTDPAVADGVYVAPYGSQLEASEEIGASTYERRFFYEVVVVGSDDTQAEEMAAQRVMPLLDAIEEGLHDAAIAGGVCQIESHPDTSRFHEFYFPSHAGRCACVQLWSVTLLESREWT